MMTESEYQTLADEVFRNVEGSLDKLDAELVDYTRSGDVLTLTFANKVRAVMNTQRPTRQMWLAAKANAWHFDYDASKKQWFDDKQGRELLLVLGSKVKENAGVDR